MLTPYEADKAALAPIDVLFCFNIPASVRPKFFEKGFRSTLNTATLSAPAPFTNPEYIEPLTLAFHQQDPSLLVQISYQHD